MKIYKSCYRNHWISPYTIIDYVFFWTDWSRCSRNSTIQTAIDEAEGKYKYIEHPEWVDRWADRLNPISQALRWVMDLVHPQIKYVKIDRWDTWNMETTLGYIVRPMLKQLKEKTHGAPWVDDEDVPLELRSTSARELTQEQKDTGHTDDNHFKRWDWVMIEMIFAFESLDGGENQDWEDQFTTGKYDYQSVKQQDGNYLMVQGPKHTAETDWDARKEYGNRIQNGFRLFGKYYQNLWD